MSNTTKTTKTNATKTNAKTTDILSIAQINNLFIDCNLKPKYTDNDKYVGCGVSANIFSVNKSAKQYNIYCNDAMFELFASVKNGKVIKKNGFSDCEFIYHRKCSGSDIKNRNNKIECKSTSTLKQMLLIVLENNQNLCNRVVTE